MKDKEPEQNEEQKKKSEMRKEAEAKALEARKKRDEEKKEMEEAEAGLGGLRGNFISDLTLVPTFEEDHEKFKLFPQDIAETQYINIYNAFEKYGHFGFLNLFMD